MLQGSAGLRLKSILSVMSIIVLLSAGFLYWGISIQKNDMEKQFVLQSEKTKVFFNYVVDNTFAPYRIRTKTFLNRFPEIKRLLKEKKGAEILRLVAPSFRLIHQENPFFYLLHVYDDQAEYITHLHDTLNFEGLQHLDSTPEAIKPVIASQKRFAGYAIGPQGLYYQIVEPVFYEDEFVGAIEFGISVAQLASALKTYIDATSTLMVDTQRWKDSVTLDIPNFNLGKYSLVYCTEGLFLKLPNHYDFLHRSRVTLDGRVYEISSNVKLKGYQNEVLGHILFAYDISEQLEDSGRFIFASIVFASCLVLFLFLVLYYSLGAAVRKEVDLNEQLTANLEKITLVNQELELEINERTKAERIKKEGEALLKSLIDSIPDLIYYKNQDGKFMGCNEAFSSMFNTREKGFFGHKTDELAIDGSYFQNMIESDHKVLESGKILIEEEWIDTDQKGSRLFHTLRIPFYDPDHKQLGMIGISRDITERKKMEEDLVATKEASEKANQAKSIFLANMSHEIRTPLNAVIGFSQIMKNRSSNLSLPQDFIEYLDFIITGGQRLSEVVSNILDLSKIESGKNHVVEETVQLNNLFKGIYHVNKALAESKMIDFKYDVDPDVPDWIYSDRTKLNQIFMNLTNNALKFTPEGKKVGIKLFKEEESFVFEVEDEGIGIENSKKKEIFKPFEQADKSISREHEGTGLGLSIARELTLLLGGSIELESEPGKGSRFRVKFPIHEAEDTAMSVSNRNIPLFLSDNRVLIVEDNEVNRIMIKELLRDLNIESDMSESGQDALTKLERIQPDLILMDMHMPGMDGLEATQNIKNNDRFSSIPVIMMTADAMSHQKEKALSGGADGYLTKPVNMTDLIDVLEQYLKVETEQETGYNIEPLNRERVDQLKDSLNALLDVPIYFTDRIVNEISNLERTYSGSDEVVNSSLSKIKDAGMSGNQDKFSQSIEQALTALSELY